MASSPGSSSQEHPQHRTRQSAARASALEPLPPEFAIGCRVHVLEKFFGTIRYLGNTQFAAGMWVGVVLDTADGKNDGSVGDVRYFACGPNMGLFARPHAVRLLDGPSRGSLHVTTVPEDPQHRDSRRSLHATTADPQHQRGSSGSGSTRPEMLQEGSVGSSVSEADLIRCKDDIFDLQGRMERVGNISDNVARILDPKASDEKAESEWLTGATKRLEQKLEALAQNLHERSEILERLQSILDQKLAVAMQRILPQQGSQCSDNQTPEVCIYPGFVEHAYRLVFPYEERFGPAAPQLLTIMPSGVVENAAILKPMKEEALIAFTYPQSMSDELADAPVSYKSDGNVDESVPKMARRDTAFVWRREDGTNALVQTWPINLNEKFRKTFDVSEGTNPDSDKFLPKAVAEFQTAMVRLFGPAAAKCPVLFCHKKTLNTSPAVVGVGEEVLAHIKKHPDLMRDLAILSVDSEGLGFVADGTSGDGKKFEKHFMLTAGERCVVYRKVGWESMGCIKPLHQFLRDAELNEPAVSIGIRENGAQPTLQPAATVPNMDSVHDDRHRLEPATTMPNLDKVQAPKEVRERCRSDGVLEQTDDMLHGHDQDCYRDYMLRLWADTERTEEDRRNSLRPLLYPFQQKVPHHLGLFGDGENSEDEWVRLVGISVLCLDFNKNVREAYKGRLPGRQRDTAEDHVQSVQDWWKAEENGRLEHFLEGIEFVQALTRYRQRSISGFVAYRPRRTGLPPNDKHPRRDGHLHTFDRRSELLVIVQGSYLGTQDTAANGKFWTQNFSTVLQALDVQMSAGHDELEEHSGYAEIVKELFPQVMAAIDKNNKPIDRVVVSGHSLGAAVGAGLVKVLHNHGKYDDLQAFLFAQPRSFKGLTDEIRMKDKVLDIHNTLDPVVAASKMYKGLGLHVTFIGDDFTGDVKPKAHVDFEY